MVRTPFKRMGASALFLAGLLVTAHALAQDPGTTPVVSAGAEVGALPTPATAPAPTGQGVVGLPATPAAPPVTEKRPPRLKSSAPPREITVASGANTVFSVALFHVNRIVTPFRTPEIRTSSAATMTVENGILYVTTQAEDPIGLFIFDKANPDQAISLTLNPAAISPVSVKINLEGYSVSQPSYLVAGNPKEAHSWETQDPYIETVKTLFKDLASNRIPDGYGLSQLQGRYAFMPNCQMPGLQIVPMQLVEGAEITAVIAKVTNKNYNPVEVNESACQSPRLIGAAAWPRTLLNPGESTELYIALQTPRFEDNSTQRPSVIGYRGN